MPFKKDLDKQSTTIRRNPNSKPEGSGSYNNKGASSSNQTSKTVSKTSETNTRSSLKTKGNPNKVAKNPNAYKTEKPEKKKSLKKRVKEVLPSKKIIESEDDFKGRNSRVSPSTKTKGQSRREYVTEQKNTGGKYTPRTEVKKGWGKKGKVTKRKLDE